MELNYATLPPIEKEINEALAIIGAKHGLNIRLNGGKFDTFDATLKIKFTQATVEGKQAASDKLLKEFALYAPMVGAEPSWFGKMIRLQGNLFRVSGIAPGRPKNAMKITRQSDGKAFVCSVYQVRVALVA